MAGQAHLPLRAWAASALHIAAASACLVVTAIALRASGIGCPIKFLTGLSCPGCGMTRAWLSLLVGDPRLAVAYHPLFWLLPVAVLLAWYRVRARRPRSRALSGALIVGCIVALMALWVLRLSTPNDMNMVFSDMPNADVVSLGKPVWLTWFGL